MKQVKISGLAAIVDQKIRKARADELRASHGVRMLQITAMDFFAAAGHTRPTLRVLEIGVGTGGGTQVILQGLTSGDGLERLCSTYAFTDISAGFFVQARERFKAYPALDFRVLDITKDPVEQGFEAASFDLIIAGNVLNVRKLLAPGGYLFFQELSPKMHVVNL
jgi:SAM-dependent methyltransferase